LGKLDVHELNEFVNLGIQEFHHKKIARLNKIKLDTVLKKKNPYLFKAKNITIASDLIKDILDAFLSSSEEKFFGDFLEELAIFIAEKTFHGRKSSATGIDLEFVEDAMHYIVSIKSGPNWGNSSQHRKQQDDFQKAVKVLKQANQNANIQPVLGICYGKSKDTYNKGYLKKSFWYLLSKEKSLYIDLIEPLGYRAKENSDLFEKQKSDIINQFTEQFLPKFCHKGSIDWKKLVEFNSGNLS